MAGAQSQKQSLEDRKYILANLPEGTRRVQVTNTEGKIEYKRPEDVVLQEDVINLASNGTPVVMRGKPGRRARVALPPANPQIAAIEVAREEHIAADPVGREISKDPVSDDAVEELLKGMAREASSLEFERLECHRNGREATNISTKRARVLKAMADLVLKKRQIAEGSDIDLDSPQYKALFGHTLETFKDSMQEAGCRPELVETVFTNFVNNLDETWKQDARRRMKDSVK